MKKIERKSMKKYMLDYIEYVDLNMKNVDNDFIQKHLIKIDFFQHERIIHLIVTITAVILDVISFMVSIISSSLLLVIIGYLIMCFVIPYIYHYFLLENGVQKMYRQYDEMIKRTKWEN